MTYTTLHLMRFIVLAFLLGLSFITFGTNQALAYFTTAQEAVALDNHSGLFLIDYTFGVAKHEVHLPVHAQNNGTNSPSAVSFTILDENNAVVEGTATAVVLSNASLQRNGMYRVSKNLGRKFTLAVIFTPTTPKPEKTYRLQVTHLPFDFDGTQALQLNPSELKYYTTKPISL